MYDQNSMRMDDLYLISAIRKLTLYNSILYYTWETGEYLDMSKFIHSYAIFIRKAFEIAIYVIVYLLPWFCGGKTTRTGVASAGQVYYCLAKVSY